MLKVSKDCYDIQKEFERGPRGESPALRAYLCPSKVWTIGWGSTSGVKPGMVITVAEAERRLMADVSYADMLVTHHVKVKLTQGMHDAMGSILFNVGAGREDRPGQPGRDGIIVLRNGQPSTLLRKLNAGDYKGAADQFLHWNKSGGRVLAGLVRRRAKERLLFLSWGIPA